MTHDPPTDAERREASALARALGQAPLPQSGAERWTPYDSDVPEDAVEAAILLRRHVDDEGLDPGREDALWARLRSSPARRGLARWWGPAALAVAAAVVLGVLLGRPPAPTDLPRPDVNLLVSQARRVAEREGATAEHARHMEEYRAEVLATLSGRYGGRR